jgi:hypothetical protein
MESGEFVASDCRRLLKTVSENAVRNLEAALARKIEIKTDQDEK